MRIGLTCSTIDPKFNENKIDGIGVYTQSLYDAYLDKNIQLTPYSFPNKTHTKISGLENGKVFPFSYSIARFLSMNRRLANLIYQPIERNIDLLHVTDHRIPRLKNVPIVATIHDTLMFRCAPWNKSKAHAIKNDLRKRTIKWAYHFITISQAMREELMLHLAIPAEKISVVHNGLSDWWLQKASDAEKQQVLSKYQLPPQILLHTGTLQPRKNVPRLIDAFLGLPIELQKQFPLVIVGRQGWDTTETLNAIKKLQAAQTGFCLNDVSNDELRVLFQCAAIYACPSLHEGFGYTVLEAFASRTPVLTANVAALPEIAGDAALLVDPYSTDEIRSGLQKLLTNESLRCQLIEKGAIRLPEFSLEKCAAETLRVYEKVYS